MPAKTRVQSIDASKAFSLQGAERIEALRSQVMGRLSAVLQNATEQAADTYGFDVVKGSDEVTEVTESEAFAGLRPTEGDFSALRNVKHPNVMIGLIANEEAVRVALRIVGAAEWRLFVKALYQYREMLGEYLTDFEDLYLLNSEGEEEAIEELDQFFAVDVESAEFKKQGCMIYFPDMDYPVETQEDFETFTGDFTALFPFYWTLLKAARSETVDMDHLLNG